jgi:hypothetical protein
MGIGGGLQAVEERGRILVINGPRAEDRGEGFL